MKKLALLVFKLGFPIALFAYLLWSVDAQDYSAFWQQPKRWELLLAAQGIALTAIMLSFCRWFILVRAFGIPFSLSEALRLGFIGYLLNFVSFGSVGGDLFKAILVAKDKPQNRPEAVASVLLDRAIGLLGLIILTWVSLTLADANQLTPLLHTIRKTSGLLIIAAFCALFLALFSGAWFDQLIDRLARLPLAGMTFARMARAVRRLRRTPQVLLGLVLLAVCVHSMLAVTVFCVSCGVYTEAPSLLEHFIVVPPGMAAGALPLAPGGIGLQEGALEQLFRQLPSLPDGFSGMIVATIYRLLTIAISGIGVVFYLFSHGREFQYASEVSAELAQESR